MTIYDVVIIGAGPAGMLCGGYCAKYGKKTLIIEKNDRVGRKLMITGKGRCNITNFCDNQTLINSVTKNKRFMYSAFSNFTPYDIVDLLETQGVPTKVERGNRVFPISDKAVDVVDALHNFCKENGAEIIKGRAVDFTFENNEISGVFLEDKTVINAKNVVIATGGKSYPLTGSTGDGYILAKKCGHSIINPVGSLVPLTVKEGMASEMQGLSLKNVAIKVINEENGKTIYEDFGEMLFTHFGLSGPMILSASANMHGFEKCSIHIDLKPALDFNKLDERLIRDFSENSNKDFANALGNLLPRKMIPVMIKLSGISPYEKVNQITKLKREKLCNLIKNLKFTVTGFRPVEEAIVTSGGIDCTQINPKTMGSKIVPNLYFAGEIIDVDAYTGGFNLQIAYSTAYAVANNI